MIAPAFGAERKRELLQFSKSASVRFKSLELLNLSLTHRSAANELLLRSSRSQGIPVDRLNNERLEFLGDAILGAITAALLYRRFPEKAEGELAKIKSVVVSEEILSGLALELCLDMFLILGKGEEQTGGRAKKAILADALEALIGALYLDSGFKAAEDFVLPRIDREIDRVLEKRVHQDYKSLLQELSQRLYKAYPVYRLVKRTGPEHERLFWMEVLINGKSYGPCTGRNKKAAEQEAARLAWEALNV
ncbi:MAG: ribonuclease III [Spirochaetaceae bacterium]|nr:ribonuclease III [Spirochaetaceae bacterium]